MLRSDACNLAGLTPEQLIKRGEHEHEWGGYFIVGGHERIIRYFVTQNIRRCNLNGFFYYFSAECCRPPGATTPSRCSGPLGRTAVRTSPTSG